MKRRYSGTFLFELYGRLCFFGIDGEIYLLEKISEILTKNIKEFDTKVSKEELK